MPQITTGNYIYHMLSVLKCSGYNKAIGVACLNENICCISYRNNSQGAGGKKWGQVKIDLFILFILMLSIETILYAEDSIHVSALKVSEAIEILVEVDKVCSFLHGMIFYEWVITNIIYWSLITNKKQNKQSPQIKNTHLYLNISRASYHRNVLKYEKISANNAKIVQI